jgi:hypothetical protein
MSMIKYQYLAKLCRFHYVTIFLKLGLVKVFCVWLFKSLVIQYSGPSIYKDMWTVEARWQFGGQRPRGRLVTLCDAFQ